jgi:hypothetical protein
MLNMSNEIRKCYAHAENCACKAKEATTEEARADFLQLERIWLKLARSYEAVTVSAPATLRLSSNGPSRSLVADHT